MIKPFSFLSCPEVHFGAGKISLLPALAGRYGRSILLVTGKRSFHESAYKIHLYKGFSDAGMTVNVIQVEKEPSPALIDGFVNYYRNNLPDVVIAVGGGSVLDAGKAVSAMLPSGDRVTDYLEGIGTKEHTGTKVPFIAVPATAGTGSEATKNAVLSQTGAQGFKKSLRHDRFIPDIAVLDPVLTYSLPPAVTASSGMDAFTQLLESFVSVSANPITDALAREGLALVAASLEKAFYQPADLEARSGMMLASFLSGLTLANAGLGLVHGFASPIGGFFDVPHGAVCSSLMYAANSETVRKLRAEGGETALLKYAEAGRIFNPDKTGSDEYQVGFLLDKIRKLSQKLHIPGLEDLGIRKEDFDRIIRGSDNKNNPVKLNAEEMKKVLENSY